MAPPGCRASQTRLVAREGLPLLGGLLVRSASHVSANQRGSDPICEAPPWNEDITSRDRAQTGARCAHGNRDDPPAPCGSPLTTSSATVSGPSAADAPTRTEASDPTSLDPLEVDPQPPVDWHCGFSDFGRNEFACAPLLPEEAGFRHGGWQPTRQRIFTALARCRTSRSALEAFATCGSRLFLHVRDDRQDMKLSAACCHNRWCQPCMRSVASTVSANLAGRIDPKRCRFLTFTLRHNSLSLTQQLDRLYSCFSMLRRRQAWKSHVTGGAAFCEIKVSAYDGRWHPHLHVVAEGSFWSQRDIAAEWLAVTGDSTVVHIRAVDDNAKAAGYVTKYLTKPVDASVLGRQEKLDEAIVALRSRRKMFTFGKWRGWKLTEMQPDAHEWRAIDSISSLLSKERDGDLEAVRWLQAARRKWPGLPSPYARFDTPAP